MSVYTKGTKLRSCDEEVTILSVLKKESIDFAHECGDGLELDTFESIFELNVSNIEHVDDYIIYEVSTSSGIKKMCQNDILDEGFYTEEEWSDNIKNDDTDD